VGGEEGPPQGAAVAAEVEDPRLTEIADLKTQVRLLELRRQELEREAKLKRLDPTYGRAPPEDPDIGFLSSLRKKELIEIEIERMKAEVEAVRRPPMPSDNSAIKNLQEELKGLRERLDEEKEKRLLSEIEDLRRTIEGLKGSTSDLQYVVGKATEFANQWVTQGGGPGAEVLLGALGYTKVPLNPNPPPPVEDAPRPPLDELAKEGLVVRVTKRDQEGQK
jgi:hypothetical protein